MLSVNKKKRIVILVLVLLCAAVGVFMLRRPHASQEMAGNLVRNGDFSRVTEGMPEDWDTGMWVTSYGTSFLEATKEDGRDAVLIENAAANDARFEQTIQVAENANYLLTALVKADSCRGGAGANLSFLGVYGSSETVFDTEGEWKRLSVYAHTGEGQKEITIAARLGGYGAESIGRAWFAEVSLTQVEEVPVGSTVITLRTPEPEQKAENEETGGTIPLLFASAVAYVLIAAIILYAARGRETGTETAVVAVLLVLAMAMRFVLAVHVPGYGVDINCFTAWAFKMAENGPMGFYEPGYFCDYPPAYMLVLGMIGLVAKGLSIPYDSVAMQVLLKTIPMLCDLALAVILYLVAEKRQGRRAAAALAILIIVNPALIIASSCWGQIDAVVAVQMVAFLLAASAGDWHVAIPVFALAVLTKPQAGLLAPLGIAALIKAVRKLPEQRKHILQGLGGGVLVTLLIVIPFSIRQESPFWWLVYKYRDTLSSYQYATLSTGNLMFLLGGNWKELGEALGPVTFGQMGTFLMVLCFLFGILVYWKCEGEHAVFLAASVTLQMLFAFGVKMHERYVIPALVLLFAAYIMSGDIRLLISGIVASAATFINIGIVLEYDYLIAPNLWAGYLLGILQIGSTILTMMTAVSLMRGEEPVRILWRRPEAAVRRKESVSQEEQLFRDLYHPKDAGLHMSRKDLGILAVVTLIYSAVAFYDLGAMKAPQTGYTSSAAEESVTLDLGSVQKDFRIYYYGGISDTQFSFAASEDGVSYSQAVPAYFDRGECFKWQAVRTPSVDDRGVVTGASGGMLLFSGRYVRITFNGAGSALWEVAAVDENGNALPVFGAAAEGALSGREADPKMLVDEQDTVPLKPTYHNSMYFDEIYHARTGYEHANSLSTYETTPPPLGKVFMSLCIRALGMTPFAWRLAGTVTGILMIPAIYLLALQLMHDKRAALLCALLMACDCMHFTQTRIATIDSFPVLFMMLMFFFMARWMQMDFYGDSFRKTLVPLVFSGIFMGLAIASKWIGCYGAVGLAVLFFIRYFHLYRQYLAAGKAAKDAKMETVRKVFWHRTGVTAAVCVVSFIILPILIYVLSYIPYLSYFGKVQWNAKTLERIWDAQVLMFDYHRNLVATHYFASPWYEWPLIIKPMWYYSGSFNEPGMVSSIMAFGNPAVWWTGLAAMIAVLGMSIRCRLLPMLGVLPYREEEDSSCLTVVVIGFLSAYLPWVLVSRLTFIYHYFASVPFIILSTAICLKALSRRRPRMARAAGIVLVILSIILFIAFYPLASGHEVPRGWCDAMNWFDGWMWY